MKQRYELTCTNPKCRIRQVFFLRPDIKMNFDYVFEGEQCGHWLKVPKSKEKRKRQIEQMQDAQGY